MTYRRGVIGVFLALAGSSGVAHAVVVEGTFSGTITYAGDCVDVIVAEN